MTSFSWYNAVQDVLPDYFLPGVSKNTHRRLIPFQCPPLWIEYQVCNWHSLDTYVIIWDGQAKVCCDAGAFILQAGEGVRIPAYLWHWFAIINNESFEAFHFYCNDSALFKREGMTSIHKSEQCKVIDPVKFNDFNVSFISLSDT